PVSKKPGWRPHLCCGQTESPSGHKLDIAVAVDSDHLKACPYTAKVHGHWIGAGTFGGPTGDCPRQIFRTSAHKRYLDATGPGQRGGGTMIVIARPAHIILARCTDPMAGAQVLECEPALHNAKLIHRQNSGKPGLRNFVAALDEALRDPVGRLGIA